MGGQRGTTFEAVVRPANPTETHQALFESDKLRAEFLTGQGPESPVLVMKVEIAPEAEVGPHMFRLASSSSGLSIPIVVQVNEEPSIVETEVPHDTPRTAQAVTHPAVINGRIMKWGEVDYYAIEVEEGERLKFEVLTPSGLIPETGGFFNDPELVLYEASGSWFDPQRAARLKPDNDESLMDVFPRGTVTGAYNVYLPRMSHRFRRGGWHLVRVGCVRSVGQEDYCYQLRIARVDESENETGVRWTRRVFAHDDPHDFTERDFAKQVGPDWYEQLRGRSMDATDATTESAALETSDENEPNDELGEAEEITFPRIIQGTIDPPGDVDHFRFKVEAGQPLAFEIRTPSIAHPFFTPHLSLLDADGEEFVTNVYRRVSNGSPVWVKSLQPKTIYTFEEEGEVTLRLRDVTARRGNADYTYQLVVRPQIAHVGEIAAATLGKMGLNRRDKVTFINLRRGQSEKLNLVTEREEGFEGEVAIGVENLPPGVRALPGSAIQPDVTVTGNFNEPLGRINKEWYRPKRQVETIILHADEDAACSGPQTLRLTALPIVNGKPGVPFEFQEIPVMVLK